MICSRRMALGDIGVLGCSARRHGRNDAKSRLQTGVGGEPNERGARTPHPPSAAAETSQWVTRASARGASPLAVHRAPGMCGGGRLELRTTSRDILSTPNVQDGVRPTHMPSSHHLHPSTRQ